MCIDACYNNRSRQIVSDGWGGVSQPRAYPTQNRWNHTSMRKLFSPFGINREMSGQNSDNFGVFNRPRAEESGVSIPQYVRE